MKEILKLIPKVIIFSGGPASVHADIATSIDKEVFNSGIPIFGICYGFQLMAQSLGGRLSKTGESEYGSTTVNVEVKSKIFNGLKLHQEV